MRSRHIPVFLLLLSAALSAPVFSEEAVQILIVTGNENAFPDAYIAAEKLAGKDPSASNKSGFRHIALENGAFLDGESVKKAILDYSDDLRVKGIIVSPAVAGTAAGFLAAKEKRADIICAAVNPRESFLLIEANADLVIGTDIVTRAVRLARLASQYGLRRIVSIPGNSPFSAEETARFRLVLASACEETGVTIVEKTSGESTEVFLKRDLESGSGKALLWPEGTLSAKLLKEFLARGDCILESPYPGLNADYAELLSQRPESDRGDYQKILKRYEKAAIDSGYAGRLGTWIFPEAFVLTSGVAEFFRKNPGKRISSRDVKPLLEEIQRFCPGTKPTLAQRIDPDTGVKSRNHFLFREDAYLLGKGFVSPSRTEIQDKYQSLKPK